MRCLMCDRPSGLTHSAALRTGAGIARVAAQRVERIDLQAVYEPALQSLECFETHAKGPPQALCFAAGHPCEI